MKQCLLACCLLASLSAFAQDFKVVGYLANWNFDDYPDKIEWNRLTHLNLAFANPDADGNFTTEGTDIDPVVTIAHAHGVKVFISLAGGYLTPEWESAWNYWMQPSQVNSLVQKIKQYVLLHQLDGVDVDLEWGYVNDRYSPFILALQPSLDSLGLPLTAALPGSYRYPLITPEALDAFDWVNLMVYDLTGPWAPGSPGQHSPYAWAEQCLQYWLGQGLPAERRTLGVPFYGYDFGSATVNSFSFADMVALQTSYADFDQVGQAYYNGRPTIQAKTMLAQAEAAGIMIWELGQDAYDDLAEYSLLRAIDEIVHPASALAEAEAEELPLPYPNPTSGLLHLASGNWANGRLQIVDAQGTVWWEGGAVASIDLGELPSGLYFLKTMAEGGNRTARFVKL